MNKKNPLPYPQLGVIDCWFVSASDFFFQLPTFLTLLSSEEINRAERFKFTIHRNRFIVAHALLRIILSQYLNQTANQLIFTQGPQNKPYLHPHSELTFNLSHSEDAILIAIAHHAQVGADIEKLNPDIDLQIAKRFFHPKENDLLDTLPPSKKYELFFQLWTGKEAILKMQGKGLSGSLAAIHINPKINIQSIKLDSKEIGYVTYPTPPQGFSAAVALSQPITTIRFGTWDPLNSPILT